MNCATTLAIAKEGLGARWDAFVASLPDPQRWHATRRIMPVEWVPLSEWYPVEEAIFAQHCGNDEKRYYDFSHKVVQSEFSNVYRAFLKVPGPEFALDKAARIFGTYFNSGGVHVVARVAHPTPADPYVMEMHMPGRYPLFIVAIGACFDALLGLTRAKAVRVSVEDRRLDEQGIFARYHLSWVG